MVARRAPAAHVLAGRGRLGAQRVHRDRLDQRGRDRAHAPPRRPARTDRARRQRLRARFVRRPRACPRALLAAVVEHARDRRYRRLLLAPTAGSTAFYRRAGFAPAGESLLAMDSELAGSPPDVPPSKLPTWLACGRGRPRTPHLPRCRASACASPSAVGCGSCPTATSPAASSGPSAGRGCRSRTRTGSTRTPAVLDRGRAHGGGERGRVRRDRADQAVDPARCWPRSTPPCPSGLDVLAAAVAEGGPLADRIDASEWRIELPGVAPADLRRHSTALLAGDVRRGRAGHAVRAPADRRRAALVEAEAVTGA